LGQKRMAPIEWPVRIRVEDGRTLVVEQTPDGILRVSVDGTAEWRTIDPLTYGLGVPSVGAVVGRTLRWWRETTGEPVIIGRRRED
jgi:hypothetical protein